MQEIVLDGRRMKTREAAHAYLKRKLSLPDYYGANLDALFDCLTDVHEETELVIKYWNAMRRGLGDYAVLLSDTLSDAARENGKVNVLFLETY